MLKKIFIFAGICAISFSYILFFTERSKSEIRKEIDGEVSEIIEKINGEIISEIIKKVNNGNNGNDSTEK